MLFLRKSQERGHANHGWLDSHHTFSFASYYDPKHMGFRKLRVINEDRVAPGMGFGTHGHRDMEIISYVVHGGLAHKDSMGHTSVIRPGEIQRMSAGTGVTHSEFNQSESEAMHFLQIWIEPDELGIEPSYEQIDFTARVEGGKPLLLVSPDGAEGSVRVHQDVRLLVSKPGKDEGVIYAAPSGRYTWMQIVKGSIDLDGQVLAAGDGAAFGPGETLHFSGREEGEILLFDLA